MALDAVITELNTHRTKLLEELARVDAALQALDGAVLQKPPTARPRSSPSVTLPSSTQAESRNDVATSHAEDLTPTVESRQRRTRNDGPQSALLRIMQAEAQREFDGRSAYEALAAAGWTSNSPDPVNVVRSTLGSLWRHRRISKVRPGVYAYTGSAVEERLVVSDDDPPSPYGADPLALAQSAPA